MKIYLKCNVFRDVKLIIVGLDDAGKTTTVACLQGGITFNRSIIVIDEVTV